MRSSEAELPPVTQNRKWNVSGVITDDFIGFCLNVSECVFVSVCVLSASLCPINKTVK